MIKFKNVNKVWPNGLHALKDINLEIKDGEFVAVIGLSGAGKTTLLKTINKINNISSGEISVTTNKCTYDLVHLKGKKLRELRTMIGLMSQEYNNLEKLTVIRNVLNARIAKLNWFQTAIGYFSNQDKEIALRALEKLNLLQYAYIRAENLSGGQQQRIALARTLSQEPSIIIADEPVSALDPILANQVMQDFQNINLSEHITIIINIHHVELAMKYATRIIGLKNGTVVFDDTPDKINNAILKEIYGGDY